MPTAHATTRCLSLLATLLIAAGCPKTEPPQPQAATPPPAPRGTGETLIDGMTGRSAVQAHQQVRTTLDNVNAERREDMREMDALLEE